jgi:hypothetical protein
MMPRSKNLFLICASLQCVSAVQKSKDKQAKNKLGHCSIHAQIFNGANATAAKFMFHCVAHKKTKHNHF